MIKKCISLLMALLMILTVFTALPAAAEELEEAELTEIAAEVIPTEEPTEAEPLAEVAATEPDGQNYPVITEIENRETNVKISWDSYGDNTIYRVYYRKANVYSGTWEEKYSGTSWTRIATVTGNSYIHNGPEDAEIGIYTVRCIDGSGEFTSDFNAEGWENCFYAAPEITDIRFEDDGVHLKWDLAWEKHGYYNGERYRVYRKTSGSGWTRLAELAEGSYIDTTAVPGIAYIYTVRMISEDGSRFLSDYLSGTSVSYDYPYLSSIENLETGVRLNWVAFTGASKYRVYYRTDDGWTRLGQVSGTSYTDTTVKDGEIRVYTVRALDSDNDFISDFKHDGWEHRFFAAPEIKTLTSATEGVELTWERPEGAGSYRVYRKTSGGWVRLTQTDGSSYTDRAVVSGTKYTYTLRMISAETEEFMSDYRSGAAITYVAAPVITDFTNKENGVKLTWDAVPGADFYRIYYQNASGGWTRLASKYLTEYVDTTVSDGETRVYTIRCLNEKEEFVSDFYRDRFVNTFYAPPVITSLTATAEGITLTWNRAEGAEDYRIYRRAGSNGWTRLAQTSASSYTDITALPGVTYTYTLRMVTADGERFMSDYLSGKSITRTETPAFSSLTNSSGGVTLKWNAVSGATYYRVYYLSGTSWVRLAQTTGTSCVDNTVQNGETRVYTLRCLNSQGDFISDFNSEGWSHTYYAAPALTSVTYQNGCYTIRWQHTEGIAAYRVYRRHLGDKDWVAIANAYAGSELTDLSDQADAFCTYTVRAQDENGEIISYFVRDNPYYRNGVKLDGVMTVGSDIYRFDNGQPASGYYLENGVLRYYQYGKRAAAEASEIKNCTRTRWLYELLVATNNASGISADDSASVFSKAKQLGIISSYSSSEYSQTVNRRYAARTIVAAFGYSKRSVGSISDVSSSDSDLNTLAYYGYFAPDDRSRLYPDSQLTTAEFNDLVEEMHLYRALKGKTVLAFGDSIMYGSGNDDIGIADMIAEKYNMTRYDYSYPGAVMGSYSNKSHIADQVRKAISAGRQPDLILINGGTNDYCHGVSLGNMTSGYDMSAIGESTYSEGFEKAMWLIANAWENTPVVYIRAHNMDLGSDALERSFGDRGIAIAGKWYAAAIDLYNDSDFNAEIQSICDRYTYPDPDEDYECDSIHPTALGYAVFYLPPVSDVLKVTFN